MELFHAELERVLENILDPNTRPDKSRKVTLTVTITPSEHSRREGTIEVEAKSSLAPTIGGSATIFVGRRRGKVIASTYDPRQMQMQWDDQDRPRAIGRDEQVDPNTGEITKKAAGE